ncbi:peptide-N4-asparagine amidase [Dokdonella sp.]|uniref:peptide-N4-asparagine amidase n=1 Tax=Dokdonella sp. TaxID=2291710 RepID=UPI001B03BC6F|nr:peptide-N4-asparagine amidase [Dokdonella sp.]MBO9661369.1 peptide-N(4)-(N-acetyl-beta-glucosaminyl)asparagine amidase [Dokdonella sp.]
MSVLPLLRTSNRIFLSTCAATLLALAAVPAAALPPIGSADVAIADPDVPPPPTTPCVVPLYEAFTFIGFDNQPFAYAPPSACPGPWGKVVLSLDFDVTAGRQFDRTGRIWLNGANIYFGTTQEPRATVAPTWHIERDLSDYSALFANAGGGYVELGNVVDGTYTGIIHGSARLAFYPRTSGLDRPPRPDRVLPLAAGPDGGIVDLVGDARLAVTLNLPTNIERAYLDVIAQSQGDDEFWYLCVPDALAGELQSCPGSGFRESQVFIDGVAAGVAPVYPWLYTGAIDPGLWRPTPSIQTLAFEPYRVDLTPFTGSLSDGRPHTVSIGVFNAQNRFSTTANLLLYLDRGSAHTRGAVTANTLSFPPTPAVDVVDDSNADAIVKTVGVTSTRAFRIAGYVDTSHGRVVTTLDQRIAFSNVQDFDIATDGSDYRQALVQRTTVDATATIQQGHRPARFQRAHSEWPLAIEYRYDGAADGSATQTTTIDQGLDRALEVGLAGHALFRATREQRMQTADTLQLDADGNLLGRVGQGSTQSYAYRSSLGACYDRRITTQDGVLSAVADGRGCPGRRNHLTWLDAFAQVASSFWGASLRQLP